MTESINLTGDSLAWYARAIYRCRYFFCTLLLIGLAYGAWQGVTQPGYRTIATLRMKNDLIEYQHRNYWDPHGRTMLAQVRGIAGSLTGSNTVSIKPESDAWMLRIEVAHHNTGEGQQLIEQVLLKWNDANQTESRKQAADTSPGPESERTYSRRLVELLDQIESLLQKLSPAIKATNDALPAEYSPSSDIRVSSEYTARLPLDELPLTHRLARAQNSIDRYFESIANLPAKERDTVAENELLSLQEKALVERLKTWGRMELFSTAASENRLLCDVVYEQRVAQLQLYLREIFLWSCLTLGAAILVIVPWVWCVDHWQIITSR
jgi:hypothetical protein